MRPYKPGDVEAVGIAIAMLRQAREHLTQAGARKSAAKVRRALKSAEGAQRHVWRIEDHAERAAAR